MLKTGKVNESEREARTEHAGELHLLLSNRKLKKGKVNGGSQFFCQSDSVKVKEDGAAATYHAILMLMIV